MQLRPFMYIRPAANDRWKPSTNHINPTHA